MVLHKPTRFIGFIKPTKTSYLVSQKPGQFCNSDLTFDLGVSQEDFEDTVTFIIITIIFPILIRRFYLF